MTAAIEEATGALVALRELRRPWSQRLPIDRANAEREVEEIAAVLDVLLRHRENELRV